MKKSFAEVVVPLKPGVARRGGEEVLEVAEDVERPLKRERDVVHVPLELQLPAVVAATPGGRTGQTDLIFCLFQKFWPAVISSMYPSRSSKLPASLHSDMKVLNSCGRTSFLAMR